MVTITVNLTPPLTGVQSKLYLVVGEEVHPVINMSPSVNGVISGDVDTSSPELDYAIIIPEQTVDGVVYLEAMSTLFNLLSNVNIFMTLETETPPPGPPAESVLEAIASAVVGTVLVMVSLF